MRIKLNQCPEGVAEARRNAGLTKTALAGAVGRSLSLISEIEGGTRNAQPDLLAKMAAILDVPVEQLTACEPRNAAAPGAHALHGERTTPTDQSDMRNEPPARRSAS
ncbi:helix-turn-helix domain-containing protein [Actinomadura rubrisoli]|uniref:XRE family transcriptional regulator n=1 Tax=Actinomadura rubrisoli TaxID=2530368 RepID=A0A4R5AAA2_9ACTN|nr:helix-turn-helix transcriptional regulator [Actinomadura rubrisoli]TDD68575.1 XRE family transcriptional regulator [Actinomadura rubrisoli]